MKRRRLVIIGIILVQFLLMGSAFVGGRMLGEQNRRTNRPGGALQLPSQLPRDPAAGTGPVQRIQDNVISLGRGFGGQGGQGGQSSNNQTDVAVTADTKFYKNTSTGQPGNPGGGQTLNAYNGNQVNPHVDTNGPFRFIASNINSSRNLQLANLPLRGMQQRDRVGHKERHPHYCRCGLYPNGQSMNLIERIG